MQALGYLIYGIFNVFFGTVEVIRAIFKQFVQYGFAVFFLFGKIIEAVTDSGTYGHKSDNAHDDTLNKK